MDAVGRCRKVVVVFGRYDFAVVCVLPVQAFKMTAIEGENDSAEAMGTGKNVGIGGRSPPVFLGRHNIVAELTKFFNHGIREVLVGVEQHPTLLHEAFFAFLIRTNCLVDFLRMGRSIIPGSLQIGRSHARDGVHDLAVRHTKTLKRH
jgi:hypothetical protein